MFEGARAWRGSPRRRSIAGGRPSGGRPPAAPASSAFRSAVASSRTRSRAQPAAAKAPCTAATIVSAARPAAAAHAHDQVLGRLGGGGDDRLGAQGVGHGDGQVVGAAFVAADEADGPAAADVDHHHAGIGRLVLQARGHRPHHQRRPARCRPAPGTGRTFPASGRRSSNRAGNIVRAVQATSRPRRRARKSLAAARRSASSFADAGSFAASRRGDRASLRRSGSIRAIFIVPVSGSITVARTTSS